MNRIIRFFIKNHLKNTSNQRFFIIIASLVRQKMSLAQTMKKKRKENRPPTKSE